MIPPNSSTLLRLHHIGFVVASIESSAPGFARSLGVDRSVLVDEGSIAFIRPFAALQTQGYFSQRSRNRSAVGTNGSSE